MSTMFRDNFSDFFFERVPFVDHIIRDTYRQYPREYSAIFNVKQSSRAFENVVGVTSLGYMAKKGEDEAITYDKFYQGPRSYYQHITYALGVRSSMEAMADDIDGILSRVGTALGRSASYSPEIVAADVINNGETAPSGNEFIGPRGEALFTATHAQPHAYDGAATYSNLGSSDFSITALRSALNNIHRITDERGKLVRFTPDILFGAPEMQHIFLEILQSDKKAGTADNDLNTFKVLYNLTLFSWNYLTDTDAWYIRCRPGEHEMNFFWRMAAQTAYDRDFDTGGMKAKVVSRFSAGYSGWRGIYASTP